MSTEEVAVKIPYQAWLEHLDRIHEHMQLMRPMLEMMPGMIQGQNDAWARDEADRLEEKASREQRKREDLRRYFAAAALTGVIRDVRADMQRRGEWMAFEEDDADNADLIAAQCFVIADAMMKAEKEPS